MKDFFGPFIVNLKEGKITLFISFNNNKTSSYRLKLGIFYFSCNSISFKKFFGHIKCTNFNELFTSIYFLDALTNFCSFIFNSTSNLLSFYKRGIDPKGELYFSSNYVYLLGEKKEVVSDFKLYDSSKFFAKNLTSLENSYRQLATNHFIKRVDYYRNLMGINQKYSVEVTDLVSFLGQNNKKTMHLKFDVGLYAFKQDVSDAIVVHELAHHYQMNHSDKFYEIVYKYCPKYDYYNNIILSGAFKHD